MRFFGSRSRTNSPMLPVKTPKVPTAATKKDKEGNNETHGSTDKKNQNGLTTSGKATDKEKGDLRKNKPPLPGRDLEKTKDNNKFLSKMKR